MMTDPSAMDQAMATLQQYSLIEMTGDMLSIHHLVQAVVRDRLPQDARRTWAEAALHLVDGAFPSESEDMGTWPQCSRLLPHALAAAGHAETLRVASRATARLLSKAGLYLHGRAEFAEAKATHERALTIIEATFGPDHPQKVATDINDPGGMLKRPGDLAEARAACEQALAVDEAIFGPDHPKVATDMNNLGRVLHGMGDLTGARAAYQRALAIIEAAFGPDDPKVTVSVNNLGSVLHDMGDLTRARAAYQRALVIDEATFGPYHPKVAISVNNLGRVLHKMGDLAGAWAAYQRALAIFEAILPPGHRYIETVRKHLESVDTSIALKGKVR
jgi:tetratricopeptide (TPR) repeat protein